MDPHPEADNTIVYDPALASSPLADPGELAVQATSDDPEIAAHVAANPNTSVDTLCMLALDPDSEVRATVAANPKTPGILRDVLADDIDPLVRIAAVEAWGRLDESEIDDSASDDADGETHDEPREPEGDSYRARLRIGLIEIDLAFLRR